mmetsp:Transcript_135725/g.378127  ORF Transcript_135725/g.378127 Transcript_135725/m.378127 type:complete len:223 (-) Transcript_135725:480-1148(-)
MSGTAICMRWSQALAGGWGHAQSSWRWHLPLGRHRSYTLSSWSGLLSKPQQCCRSCGVWIATALDLLEKEALQGSHCLTLGRVLLGVRSAARCGCCRTRRRSQLHSSHAHASRRAGAPTGTRAFMCAAKPCGGPGCRAMSALRVRTGAAAAGRHGRGRGQRASRSSARRDAGRRSAQQRRSCAARTATSWWAADGPRSAERCHGLGGAKGTRPAARPGAGRT